MDPMLAALVALSPGTSLPFRIAGRPATFMDRTLNLPDVAARHRPSSRAVARAAFSFGDGFILQVVPEQSATDMS